MLVLTLYSRPECHLCDEMKAVVAEVTREMAHELTEIDISADPELERRYGTRIPVLMVNGREAFQHRVQASELRGRLAREIP
jgi:glutaredoxin